MLLRELEALDADGRITAEGRSLRALPLPPRLARMIVDAGREGHAREAAQIAAVLSERGLGGDNVDLDARLDQFRRDRSQRASAARQQAERWVRQLRNGSSPAADKGAFDRRAAVARVSGSGCAQSRQWIVRAGERTRRFGRPGVCAGARAVSCGRRGHRSRREQPYSAGGSARRLTEIEQRFADEIEAEDEIVFDIASMSLRGRRKRKLHAVTLGEQTMQLSPNADTARIFADGLAQAGLARLPWSKALQQWRDRVMFLRKSGR